MKIKRVALFTCPPQVEGGVVASEGSSFPFEREEGDGASFSKIGASDAAGAGPLELAFAFFEGGSIKPSSMQTNG
jgi:hypothetical protein